jgi:hypothetical protein
MSAAILFVSQHRSSRPQIGKVRALLPLVDKPALQIATESLVRLGCREFHVFLSDSPGEVRDFLGNGERWGIDLTYHYLDEDLSFAANLKRLNMVPEQSVWLGCADSLPEALILPLPKASCAPDTAFCHRPDGRFEWTGWGYFSATLLQTLDCAANFPALEERLATDAAIQQHCLGKPYNLSTDHGYLESSIRRLELLCRDKPEQVYLSRGAWIHPAAKITGPVFIGPQARIEADAVIGPNVVIGDDAVIDQRSELRESIVLPGTYVGADLFLEEAIVAPGSFASIKNNTLVHKIDLHLLAASRQHDKPRQLRWQLAVVLLQACLFPLYGLARLKFDPSKVTDKIWLAHFIQTFYPGLQAVARGDIRLFGPALRDANALAKLPTEWQSLYHNHPGGLLNESVLDATASTDPVMRYASDACAAAGLGTATRLKILGCYFRKVLRDFYSLTRASNLAQTSKEIPSHSSTSHR